MAGGVRGARRGFSVVGGTRGGATRGGVSAAIEAGAGFGRPGCGFCGDRGRCGLWAARAGVLWRPGWARGFGWPGAGVLWGSGRAPGFWGRPGWARGFGWPGAGVA